MLYGYVFQGLSLSRNAIFFTSNQNYVCYNTVLHFERALLDCHTIQYTLLKYHNYYPSGILASLYLFGLTELGSINKLY